MADRMAGPRRHVDADGVRTVEGPGVRTSVWLLTLAMALVGIALFVIVRPALLPNRPPATTPPAPAVAAALVHHPPPMAPTRLRPPVRPQVKAAAGAPPALPVQAGDAQPQRLQPAQTPQPQPDYDAAPPAADAGQDQAAAEAAGIAAFPPPGSKPILRGIVVPDDFELPPGYVRHYQTTDDGHQLLPILMFHPDYHPVDANGAPIALPADRVVPPGMAPPGMPVQQLDVPDNQPATDDSPRGARGPLPNS